MTYSKQVAGMCSVARGASQGPSPIPEEGKWIQAKEITDISGLSHGVGTCAPQQGACKLTLNVKNGIIEEALVETIGCTGMTHSAAMAAELITGRTLLEALNTDLVCDAINVAMREIFCQFVYGRTQTAFSEGGMPIGGCLEDLGKNMVSSIGTLYSSTPTGVRYLDMVEGHILKMGLDENNEVIGYQFLSVGRMLKDIREGIDPQKALEKEHRRIWQVCRSSPLYRSKKRIGGV